MKTLILSWTLVILTAPLGILAFAGCVWLALEGNPLAIIYLGGAALMGFFALIGYKERKLGHENN